MDNSVEAYPVRRYEFNSSLRYNSAAGILFSHGNTRELEVFLSNMKHWQVNSFLGGTVHIEQVNTPLKVYRTGDTGKYWSTQSPISPWQNSLDMAMHPGIYPDLSVSSLRNSPNWHPANKGVLSYIIPEGSIIARGRAAPQHGWPGMGEQVFLPSVETTGIRRFSWPEFNPYLASDVNFHRSRQILGQAKLKVESFTPHLRAVSRTVHQALHVASFPGMVVAEYYLNSKTFKESFVDATMIASLDLTLHAGMSAFIGVGFSNGVLLFSEISQIAPDLINLYLNERRHAPDISGLGPLEAKERMNEYYMLHPFSTSDMLSAGYVQRILRELSPSRIYDNSVEYDPKVITRTFGELSKGAGFYIPENLLTQTPEQQAAWSLSMREHSIQTMRDNAKRPLEDLNKILDALSAVPDVYVSHSSFASVPSKVIHWDSTAVSSKDTPLPEEAVTRQVKKVLSASEMKPIDASSPEELQRLLKSNAVHSTLPHSGISAKDSKSITYQYVLPPDINSKDIQIDVGVKCDGIISVIEDPINRMIRGEDFDGSKEVLGFKYDYEIKFTGFLGISGYVDVISADSKERKRKYFDLNFKLTTAKMLKDKKNQEKLNNSISQAVDKLLLNDINSKNKRIDTEYHALMRDFYSSEGTEGNPKVALDLDIDKLKVAVAVAPESEAGELFKAFYHESLKQALKEAIESENYARAQSLLLDAKTLLPDSDYEIKQAQIYHGLHDYEAATPFLQAIHNADPENRTVNELLVSCYEKKGYVFQLKTMLAELRKKGPLTQGMDDAHKNTNRLFKDLVTHPNQVIQDFKIIQDSNPSTSVTPASGMQQLHDFAQAFKAANYAEAAKKSRKMQAESACDDPALMKALTTCLVRQNKYKDAIEEVKAVCNRQTDPMQKEVFQKQLEDHYLAYQAEQADQIKLVVDALSNMIKKVVGQSEDDQTIANQLIQVKDNLVDKISPDILSLCLTRLSQESSFTNQQLLEGLKQSLHPTQGKALFSLEGGSAGLSSLLRWSSLTESFWNKSAKNAYDALWASERITSGASLLKMINHARSTGVPLTLKELNSAANYALSMGNFLVSKVLKETGNMLEDPKDIALTTTLDGSLQMFVGLATSVVTLPSFFAFYTSALMAIGAAEDMSYLQEEAYAGVLNNIQYLKEHAKNPDVEISLKLQKFRVMMYRKNIPKSYHVDLYDPIQASDSDNLKKIKALVFRYRCYDYQHQIWVSAKRLIDLLEIREGRFIEANLAIEDYSYLVIEKLQKVLEKQTEDYVWMAFEYTAHMQKNLGGAARAAWNTNISILNQAFECFPVGHRVEAHHKFFKKLKNIGLEKLSGQERQALLLSFSVFVDAPPNIPGLHYQPVPADGNCLYHAMALHLDMEQKDLREKVANYLVLHRDELENFVAGDFEKHVEGIRKEAWGDDLELNIMMQLYSRLILVIGKDGKLKNNNARGTFPVDTACFLYYEDQHYDALLFNKGTSSRDVIPHLLNIKRHESIHQKRVMLAYISLMFLKHIETVVSPDKISLYTPWETLCSEGALTSEVKQHLDAALSAGLVFELVNIFKQQDTSSSEHYKILESEYDVLNLIGRLELPKDDPIEKPWRLIDWTVLTDSQKQAYRDLKNNAHSGGRNAHSFFAPRPESPSSDDDEFMAELFEAPKGVPDNPFSINLNAL